LKSTTSPRKNYRTTNKKLSTVRHSHLPKVKTESWHKGRIVYQQQCPIGVCQNPGSDWKSLTNRNSQVALYRDNQGRSKFVRFPNKIRGCRKSDSNGDHTRRTSAYCQSQNKHCEKYTSYISKRFEFHSVGLKRTHITVERDL
jgi:hypothetical protein